MSDSKETGSIYILCLPRKALFDLFNLLGLENDSSEKKLQQLFGKPSYTFSDPDKLTEAAPLREFGKVSVSLQKRVHVFQTLPESFREYIKDNYPSHHFGFYTDSKKRCYKKEEGDRWTVLVPSNLKKKEIYFPEEGEHLTLRYIHSPEIKKNFVVQEIGMFKKATAIIYFI